MAAADGWARQGKEMGAWLTRLCSLWAAASREKGGISGYWIGRRRRGRLCPGGISSHGRGGGRPALLVAPGDGWRSQQRAARAAGGERAEEGRIRLDKSC